MGYVEIFQIVFLSIAFVVAIVSFIIVSTKR